MPVIAVASMHGSPGATTLAVALAARLATRGASVTVVEADPDGGVLAARFDLALSPTLTDAAAWARGAQPSGDLGRFAQPLTTGVRVLVAHPAAEQTSTALRVAGVPLGFAVLGCGPVVVDAGRWRPGSPARALAERADRVLLVVRPVLEQLVQVVHAADGSGERGRLGVVVVGERPYSARQVEEATGVEVLARVPDDAAAVVADPFAGSTGRRHRWSGAVTDLAERLGQPASRAAARAS